MQLVRRQRDALAQDAECGIAQVGANPVEPAGGGGAVDVERAADVVDAQLIDQVHTQHAALTCRQRFERGLEGGLDHRSMLLGDHRELRVTLRRKDAELCIIERHVARGGLAQVECDPDRDDADEPREIAVTCHLDDSRPRAGGDEELLAHDLFDLAHDRRRARDPADDGIQAMEVPGLERAQRRRVARPARARDVKVVRSQRSQLCQQDFVRGVCEPACPHGEHLFRRDGKVRPYGLCGRPLALQLGLELRTERRGPRKQRAQ